MVILTHDCCADELTGLMEDQKSTMVQIWYFSQKIDFHSPLTTASV